MIKSADERDIVGRYLLGHDALRIAADIGRRSDEVGLLLGRLCNWDRGRARQVAGDWDRLTGKARGGHNDVPPPIQLRPGEVPRTMPSSPPADTSPLRAEIDLLTRQLRQRETENQALRVEIDGLRGTLRRHEAAAAEVKRLTAQLQAAERAAAAAQAEADRFGEQIVEAEARFAAELKQLGLHLSVADEMAQLYKARIDRLYERVGWGGPDNDALIVVSAVRRVLDGDDDVSPDTETSAAGRIDPAPT